ncbi:hypothetical protein A143_09680 [Vibrio splendidus ZS-139]|nr:hypothetical protein A143_09680 [Vibrio splendidus ZS-139]
MPMYVVRNVFLFWLIIFRIFLDFSYIYFVSDIFGYDGFDLKIELPNYIISWVMCLPFFLLLNGKLKNVRDYTEIFWALLVVFPIVSMFGLNSDNPIDVPLLYLFSFFTFYILVRIKLFKLSGIPKVRNGLKFGLIICISFVVLLVINYAKSGVSLNLNFLKVYEFREGNSELSSGGILTYINIWTYKVFNITLLCLALFYRKYLYALIIFTVQIYFFAASAHKSVLFIAILVISIWWAFKERDTLILFPVSLVSVIIIALFQFYYTSDITLASIFIRRLFYIPAQLGYYYYEFFSSNEYVYWSNTILSPLLTYPYPDSISHTVGNYMGRSGSGANNGLIASGYAHAGIFGVFIYTVVFALLVKLIEFLGMRIFPLWFLLSIFIVPISSAVLNSDLLTTLSTHGFGVAIFILYLIRKEKTESNICSN